mmetsp:Transcript_31557/g.80879  ORF Transcript_31557/g.80879 Transcript_31557/m.80879 type:complete len:364 (+) Transcript_31557:65-1156(+)|eukprot:jgi/Tetstr1/442048/TSEL_030229.t1
MANNKAKKRKAAAADSATVVADAAPAAGGAHLAAHIKFFDKMVELIPAKYYHDSGHEGAANKFLPKAERAAARSAAKDAAKAAKKTKLDPDQAKTALDVQREAAGAAPEGAPAEGQGGKQVSLQFNVGAGSASRDTLKAKLAARLQELRKQRNAEERANGALKAKEWQKAATRGAKSPRAKPGKGTGAAPANGKAARQGGPGGKPQPEADLTFGKVQLPESGRGQNVRKRGKKPSTGELLAQATAKKEKAAAMAGTSEGKELAASEAWKSALARAQGERVLDDPKLLRRSLKKETKQKAKSRDAWQERTRKETEKKDATQKKRKDNLKRRADAKIQKKKDKRDKKLLRPGFEGRKLGSIQKKA